MIVEDQKKRTNSFVTIVQKPKGFGIRHVQFLLLFFASVFSFGLRNNLSLAIVAMADDSLNPEIPHYYWNESIRGFIYSSFFWGYVLTPFPASILAHHFGPKLIFGVSSTISAILTLCTPFIISFGWEYLFATRLLLGLLQDVFAPCTYMLCSKWLHPSERDIQITLIVVGSIIGTVLVMATGGVIAASRLGWPGLFYVPGGATLIWCIAFYFLSSNSPGKHSFISKIEKDFIESTPGLSKDQPTNIPWKQILTSMPFLAIIAAHCAENWGYYTLLTEIPSYMFYVLKFDIKSNSMFSALPYVVRFGLGVLLSKIAQIILNNGYLSVTKTRKLFNTIGMWIPAVLLIILGYIPDENAEWVVTILTFSVGVNAATIVGFFIALIDISPNYLGVLVGISHSIGNILSLLGPIFVGYVVSDATDPTLWRIFFFTTAGIFFIGNLVFLCFGNCSLQDWNEYDNNLKIESVTDNVAKDSHEESCIPSTQVP